MMKHWFCVFVCVEGAVRSGSCGDMMECDLSFVCHCGG